MTVQHHSRLIVSAHILWTFVALALPCMAFATSIVVLVDDRNHRIIIAADSFAESQVLKNQGKVKGRRIVCKILQIPGCVSGVNGAVAFSLPLIGNLVVQHFDIQKFAKDACQTSGDLRTKADSFLVFAKPAAVELARFEHDRTSQAYQERVARGDDLFDAFFAGMQDGRLSVFVRGFTGTPDGDVQPLYGEIPPVAAVFLGDRGSIARYLARHPDWNQGNKVDFVAMAKAFVQMEIKDLPNTVGPPISILELIQGILRPDQFETQWIQHGACKPDAQKKNSKPN